MIILSAGNVRIGLEGVLGNIRPAASGLVALSSADGSSADCVVHVAAHADTPSSRIGMFAVTLRSRGQVGSPNFIIAPSERVYPWVPGLVFRLVHPAFVSRPEYVAQLLTDQILDPLVHVLGLKRGQSCLHASAVESDGRVVAVVGAGGSGKTPSMLQLLRRGWRFLSDDWTTVDSNGWIQRSYKTIQIHARDIESDPWMRHLLEQSQSPVDRVAWRLRTTLGSDPALRRRVDPESLLPRDLVGRRGRLSEVFIIVRSNREDVDLSSATPSQAAALAADLTLQDLPTLNQFVTLSAEAPWAPTRERGAREATRAILSSAFSQARLTVLSVPQRTPEGDVGRLIAETIGGT